MDEERRRHHPDVIGRRATCAPRASRRSCRLEDIAAQTRIPLRHLESLEIGDWDKLPAPTYTIGFAKSYATAVGLDRTEIGDQLRSEMGGQRYRVRRYAEVFEPADPARTMPQWLVLSAIGAIVLLVRRHDLAQQPLAGAGSGPGAFARGRGDGTGAKRSAQAHRNRPNSLGRRRAVRWF